MIVMIFPSIQPMPRVPTSAAHRDLRSLLNLGALLLLTAPLTTPLLAGEVEITWIGEKQQPLKGALAHTNESIEAAVKVMRNSLGDEAAEQLRQALEQTKGYRRFRRITPIIRSESRTTIRCDAPTVSRCWWNSMTGMPIKSVNA